MQENSSTSNSKRNIVLAVKVSIFVLLIITLCYLVGLVFEYCAKHNHVNEWNQQRFTDFYNSPTDSLGLIFLGSSHSYCSFDPENFDDTLNTDSFQLGMPEQHPDSTYYTLQEVLKTQKPKTAVVELYWDMLDDDFSFKQVDMLFEAMNDPELEQEFIDESFPMDEKIKYHCNFIRYQQDFFNYSSAELKNVLQNHLGLTVNTEAPVGEENYKDKGYIYCNYVMTDDTYNEISEDSYVDGSSWKFSSVQEEYLRKIVDLCNENNINLVFVTAPVSNIYFSKINNYDNIHNQIAEFANEEDVPYLDFNKINKQTQLLPDDAFRDYAHLNDSGAKIVDSYLCNWLIENSIPY